MSGLSVHLQLGNEAVLGKQEEEQEHDLPLLVHHNEILWEGITERMDF